MASSSCSSTSNEFSTESSFTSQWRTPASRLSKYNTSWSLVSFSRREDPFADLKQLFQILLESNVPGPRLLRLKTEFNKSVGLGGQAHVYAASQAFEESLHLCHNHHSPPIRESARSWPSCVIKQLRSDPSRDLNFQVGSALSEIKRLCHTSLRGHSNIVTLSGWGLCLDALEGPSLTVPRLPFLILEKALCDLTVFLRSSVAGNLDFSSLSQIALDIGRGVGAIHRAEIAHGDLKPDNILIFERRPDRTSLTVVEHHYMAKVCDFGSATEVLGPMNLKAYLGTPYWRPPEFYNSSPPISLQLCDIFTYGLIIWALFLRSPSSPISDIENKGSRHIQTARGQQEYFSSASESIRINYGSIANPRIEDGQVYNSAFRSGFFALLLPDSAATLDYGPSANRILAVLSSSLGDNPLQRDLRPWRYLNTQGYPEIREVRVPAQYLQRSLGDESPPAHSARFSIKPRLIQLSKLYQRASTQVSGTIRRRGLSTWYQLKIWIPALRPGSSKQRAYEQYHATLSELLGPDPSEQTLLDHPDDGPCFDLRPEMLPNFISTTRSFVFARSMMISFYCVARMRNRFKNCCWKALHAHGRLDPFEVFCEVLLEPSSSSMLSAIIYQSHLDIMAWFFRSDSGQELLLHDDRFLSMVAFPEPESTGDESFDEARTMWILLLFERGLNIGSDLPVEPGKPRW